MNHEIFVSYSSSDKAIADAIVAKLEQANVRCWIAPRDVLAGMEYGKAIGDAISSCRILVVVFSSMANSSAQVRHEVERALAKSKIIVPFRIDEIKPTGAMEHYLAGIHWLDALTPPLEQHIAALTDTVRALLGVTELPTCGEIAPQFRGPGLSGPTDKEQDPFGCRRGVRSAAIALMIVSAGWICLDVLCLLVGIPEAASDADKGTYQTLIIFALFLAANIFNFFAFRQMRRICGYKSAMIASILLAFSTFPFFVGIPFSIWSITVLRRKKVREYFISMRK